MKLIINKRVASRVDKWTERRVALVTGKREGVSAFSPEVEDNKRRASATAEGRTIDRLEFDLSPFL